jgi:hypothetical protein
METRMTLSAEKNQNRFIGDIVSIVEDARRTGAQVKGSE